MKYNVGDKVRIKNLDWYNENKDEYGNIDINHNFTFYPDRSKYCGKVFTISEVFDYGYTVKEDNGEYYWTDEMIEGPVDEEIKNWADVSIPDDPFTVTYGSPSMNDSMNKNNIDNGIIILPEGYIFKDENGNEILTSKIILEKKKNEYPKTYDECCKVLGYVDRETYCVCHTYANERLFESLYRLKVCRDAYWQVYGEENGLGKPWEPDWEDEHQEKYIIGSWLGTIQGLEENFVSHPLAFPTPEMRDAFKENFDPDIEICKEFL